MRIAAVVEEFPVLSETFILSQLTGLLERGHELDLYAFAARPADQAHPDVLRFGLLDNVRYAPALPRGKAQRLLSGLRLCVINLPRHPGAALGAVNMFRFGRYARSLRLLHDAAPFFAAQPYDVVHAHFGQVGVRVELLRRLGLLRGRFFVSFYGFDISQRVRLEKPGYYHPLFAAAERVLVLSQIMRQQVLDQGCPAGKVLVHHLGADGRRFQYHPRKLEGGESIRIVSVARLAEKKGLQYGIRAVAQVASRYPNLRYQIIGDGPLRAELEALIAELKMQPHIELLGWRTQEEVVKILDRAHLLLAPSVTAAEGDQEGTPTVIAEAMLMGLPVLSTLHSGIPEMVQDGVTGLLAPERDVPTLAAKLDRLLAQPTQWETLGAAGRAFAAREFEVGALNDRLVEHYQADK